MWMMTWQALSARPYHGQQHDARHQGLTLFNFSAQRKRFLLHRGYI